MQENEAQDSGYRRMTLEELAAYSEQRHTCICLDLLPLVPLHGETIRASEHCFMHKMMAEKWDSINSWEEFYAVQAADKQRVAQATKTP